MSDSVRRWLRAGLATAIVDGIFASTLNVVGYGSTVAQLWQRVASTLLGPSALQGGARTALIGVAMHIGVAFTWSAVFVFLVMRSERVRRAIEKPLGVLAVAAVYGPLIWIVMSFVVIPTLTRNMPAITVRWWIQAAGHVLFVAVPMILAARGAARTADPSLREG